MSGRQSFLFSAVHEPGTWKGLLVPDGQGGYVRKASFTCPACGGIASLSNHEIAANGAVSPSVVCPFGCEFHEFILLEGWESYSR